jgi:hypothetical protein
VSIENKKIIKQNLIFQNNQILFEIEKFNINTVSIKSAHAMWKVLMVQSCDNDILEGLAVANPPQTQNPLFFSWRD